MPPQIAALPKYCLYFVKGHGTARHRLIYSYEPSSELLLVHLLFLISPSADSMATADLCDKHIGDIASYMAGDQSIAVMAGNFNDYGGKKEFSGPAFTVKCYECNTLVRKALEGPGEGRVLVVDGDAGMHCALVGDQLGVLAVKNGWSGIIVNGPIRDSKAMATMDVGVKALGTCPLKSDKAAAYQGQQQVDIEFGGVKINPGDWIYADSDGILVSKKGELTA